MTTRSGIIAFLSDYGHDDPFVGLCHAVMAVAAPEVRVVDLSHAVEPQAVRQGALLLADCLPWLPPPIVLLAVVDPGVGTQRRGVVVAAGADRRLLVGPDNGLLLPAARAAGGVTGAWALRPPEGSARTFDGRDVFAPAAARLVSGAAPEDLGTPIDPAGLVTLELPAAHVSAGTVRAEVGHVDRFGNVQLIARPQELAAAGLAPGTPVSVTARVTTVAGTLAEVFADVPVGQVAVLPDSFGRVQVAVNQGSAARRLGAGPGDTVVVTGHGELG